MLEDADNDDPNCLSRLTSKLNDKITTTPSTQWNTWLYGALIGYAYATGERLVYKGYGSTQLDTALKVIHDNWTMTGRDPSCTKESLNQCVDDFLVASPGWAWSAAYWYRRGDPYSDVAYFKQQALDTIAAGFNEVCIARSPSNPGDTYCNGTAADLEVSGVSAGTQRFNHGQRCPLTATASSPARRSPRSASKSSEWRRGTSSRRIRRRSPAPLLMRCRSTSTPGMPAGTYQGDMNSWQLSQFHLGSNDDDFFSWGRFMTYYRLSHDWVVLFRW